MLRDALVFGLNSDKVRKDAIALGNKLPFQQINDLAKTEENKTARMKAITLGSSEIKTKEMHSVGSAKGNTGRFQHHREPQNIQRHHRNANNSK